MKANGLLLCVVERLMMRMLMNFSHFISLKTLRILNWNSQLKPSSKEKSFINVMMKNEWQQSIRGEKIEKLFGVCDIFQTNYYLSYPLHDFIYFSSSLSLSLAFALQIINPSYKWHNKTNSIRDNKKSDLAAQKFFCVPMFRMKKKNLSHFHSFPLFFRIFFLCLSHLELHLTHLSHELVKNIINHCCLSTGNPKFL